MKLKFKKQQFQIDAVNAAAELLKGQTGGFTDTNAMTNCDEIIKKAGQEMRLF